MNTLLSQYKQHLKKYGVSAKVDGNDIRLFFKEYEDNLNPLDNKFMFSNPINLVKQGSIIDCLGAKWMVMEKPVNINSAYDKSVVREINFGINFNFKGAIIKFPAIVDTKVFDLTQTQYIVLPNNKILVTLADTIETRKITENQRFIIMRKVWKVTGIDETKKGLLILNCGSDAYTETYDDMENEIADRWRYETKPTPHTYTISTSNKADNTIEIGKTLQFVVTVTDNGTAITTPTISYSSNNINCTVNNTTGLITGNTEGSSIITATYTDPNGNAITTFINVTVSKAIVADNYTLTIDGSDSVQSGTTGTYTALIKNNGVDVTDKSVTWTLVNSTGGAVSNTIASLTNITDRTVEVNAKEQDNYVTLKATLNVDTSKSATKQIYISGGW